MLNNRVLNRMGARVLTQEEMKRVGAGTETQFFETTRIMSFVGVYEPDFKPDLHFDCC